MRCVFFFLRCKLNPQYAQVFPKERQPSGTPDSNQSTPMQQQQAADEPSKLNITDIPRTSTADYPRSILNFVLHSQKSVILADASTDKVFGSDPCQYE